MDHLVIQIIFPQTFNERKGRAESDAAGTQDFVRSGERKKGRRESKQGQELGESSQAGTHVCMDHAGS